MIPPAAVAGITQRKNMRRPVPPDGDSGGRRGVSLGAEGRAATARKRELGRGTTAGAGACTSAAPVAAAAGGAEAPVATGAGGGVTVAA
jgi:hypothetical protein